MSEPGPARRIASLLQQILSGVTDRRKMLQRALLGNYNTVRQRNDLSELSLRDLALIDALKLGPMTPGQLASQIDFGTPDMQAALTPSSRNATSQAINRIMREHYLICKQWNTDGDQRQPLVALSNEGEKLKRELLKIDTCIFECVVQEMNIPDLESKQFTEALTSSAQKCITPLKKEANSAGVYDYVLGGRYWSPADAQAAERVIAQCSVYRDIARQNRTFLRRAVWHLVKAENIQQFLDVGSGYPTYGNTHEIARLAHYDARTVYVDNNSEVVRVSQLILKHDPNAKHVAAIFGDLRNIGAIFMDAAVTSLIDFSRPVGILLVAVMHFVQDDNILRQLITRIAERVASGSCIVVSHAAPGNDPAGEAATTKVFEKSVPGVQVTRRTKEQLNQLFDGWQLIKHSELCYISEWGKDIELPDLDDVLPPWGDDPTILRATCGVYRKP